MEKNLEFIKELRNYSLSINLKSMICIQEEENHLMRFANSGISLNTSEHIITVNIEGYDGKRKASRSLITDYSKADDVKKAMDELKKVLEVSEELSFVPSIPVYEKNFINEESYDEDLRNISNEEKLAYFNEASKGLESNDIKLSGNFLNGYSSVMYMTTESEFYNLYKETDAQLLVVLSSESKKWEVNSEASLQKKSDLDAKKAHDELSFMVNVYKNNEGCELPVGDYEVIIGKAAIAEILMTMSYQMTGDAIKRGYGFVNGEDRGKKIFSDKFTLRENPNLIETYPFKADIFGVERSITNIFEDGKLNKIMWSQNAADEFGEKSTGHTLPHFSMEMLGGDSKIRSLEDIKNMPKDKDILYIPYIHYMNLVNPSEGLLTGSSRFGAMLFKKDGTVVPPFNVRLTRTYKDFFGDELDWISEERCVYNLTNTYGIRNPVAIVVPKFIKLKKLEISASNKSF